ncbi:MAG: alkaline phosphatase family protein [Bdellovibrionales bacterium]|nr:alkaline phosphatase family protein [Bdellovibrionales bacterium]
MKKFTALTALVAYLAITLPALAAPISEKTFSIRPKLVVVIAIDQMRADYLTRFRSRFLAPELGEGKPGGFRFLMSRGAYFPFGEYDVLHNMTGPGHAMILSGSYPYQMGIALNDWYESDKGQVYCVRDDSSPLVVGQSSWRGLSPKNFLGTTVGDELKNAGYSSKVVTVALKDRAAILLGGHRADLALWFDPKNMQWTTSRHYIPEGGMPSWVEALSQSEKSKKGQKYEWNVSGPGTGLSSSKTSGLKISTEYGSYESFAYPMGVDIVLNAAKAAVTQLKLGRGQSPDLLAMSFSSHDYLAHAHGANAREMEEMTIAEDKQLSGFLQFLKKELGSLDDVLLALTADHGGPYDPEWLKTQKIPAGNIDQQLAVKQGNDRLNTVFGKPASGKPYVAFAADFNFFLDPEVLAEKKLDPAAVETALKKELLGIHGILTGFTKTEYRLRQLPPVLFERQTLKGYMPGRSGDVVLIPKPHFQTAGSTVSHQTGYAYDRTVPIILMGKRIKPGVYSERAEVIDIAPTLSFLLGITRPAMSEGRVLSEILTDPK